MIYELPNEEKIYHINKLIAVAESDGDNKKKEIYLTILDQLMSIDNN